MIKIYYDNFFGDLEIVEPDGSYHWFWYDTVDNSCGWYKGSSKYMNHKNDPSRFELIGEL